MDMLKYNRCFFSSVFLSFLLCLLFCMQAFASDNDVPFLASEERIEKINKIISSYVKAKEDMTDETVQSAILNEISDSMILTPKEVKKRTDLKALNERAGLITDRKYGTDQETYERKLREEAESMFKLYELKDKVVFCYKRGGAMTTVSGTLYRITSSSILVDYDTISFIDMDLVTRAKFDPKANQELKNSYVASHLADMQQEKTRYQLDIFTRLKQKQDAEDEANGYIFIKRKDLWRTAESIAKERIAEEAEKYKKRKEKEAKRLAKLQKQQEEAEAKALAAEAEKNAAKVAAAKKASDGTTLPDGTLPENGSESVNTRDSAGNEFNDLQDPQANVHTAATDVLGESDTTPKDTGGDFIAMSPKEISAAMRRIRVNEVTYQELMKKVEKRVMEINSTYYGIDADQGFKKALWGFSEIEVYYALSKEQEAAFLKKNTINRNDIVYPEGSRPSRILLHYHLSAMYKVDVYMGNLTQKEFNIYKNSLSNKYGVSDTQNAAKEDLFLQIADENITPDKIPVILPAKLDERGNPLPLPDKYPFIFVWEGRLSQGILSFDYDETEKMYKNVLFEKIYMPDRLEEEKRKKAEQEAASEKKQENATEKKPQPE